MSDDGQSGGKLAMGTGMRMAIGAGFGLFSGIVSGTDLDLRGGR